MTEDFQIYLASTSPRRRELLDQLGIRYQAQDPQVPEALRANESPEVHVLRLALEKARAVRARVQDERCPVLGADTAVVVDGRVLGKPRDREDGLAMLQCLSGRSHRVLTAVALIGTEEASRLSVSTVHFRVMSEAERVAYWETGEPSDKAGGYAVQGRAAAFIARLEGSYSGVMGLPLYEVAELLAAAGVPVLGQELRDSE